MSGSPIIRDDAERQAAIDRFHAEGKSAAWIHGWWRFQMRHQDDEGQEAAITRWLPE
jgi:hypothetical protein